MMTNLVPPAYGLAEHAASLREEPLRLPAGRSEAQAIADAVHVKRALWRNIKHEDQRLQQLEDYCTRLCSGDRQSGRRLAARAVWTP